MARGDKSKYTNKQKRQAEHIEEGYKEKGVPEDTAERIAWATVNKESGGGKKSGSGRQKKKDTGNRGKSTTKKDSVSGSTTQSKNSQSGHKKASNSKK